MKIDVPLFVILPRKTKADRKVYLNLNNYPNWYYITYNNLKKVFCESLGLDLRGVKLQTPISIHFTLYKGSKRKTDRSNILAVIEKFFCDALTHHECIPDDNDEFISGTSYSTGGIDKDNPRCEIEITENSPE